VGESKARWNVYAETHANHGGRTSLETSLKIAVRGSESAGSNRCARIYSTVVDPTRDLSATKERWEGPAV
jgi:hypothetical protein